MDSPVVLLVPAPLVAFFHYYCYYCYEENVCGNNYNVVVVVVVE
jgi:hypothetical protein